MNKIELDNKIDLLLQSNEVVEKKDLITFYWTRKNPNLLLNLIKVFAKDNDVIFDPFLGSAPILFSIDKSNKNINFVGSEINEMPISFINFNLNTLSENELSDIKKKFISFYEKHINLYQYTSPIYNEKITLSKVIIDRKDNVTEAKEFIFSTADKLTASASANEGFYKSCLTEYNKRYIRLQKEIEVVDIELITNSRIAVKSGMKLSHLFNPINYYVLMKFSEEFKTDKLMLNVLSSVLHLCRLTDMKSQSQFPYWVPTKDIVERNILLLILKKIDYIIKHKKSNTLNLSLVNSSREFSVNKKSVYILNKPSQLISDDELPNNSIDYVITDPPYFDQVAYSEYLKIWEHICHFKANLKNEIILSNRKEEPSSERLYLENLTKCFTVVSKKLKTNGLAIIFFKDSKPKNIYLFLKAMDMSNFEFIRAVHIGNKKFTYKQNTTQDTTVGGECLFFFRKKTDEDINVKYESNLSKIELNKKIEEVATEFTTKYLEKNTEASLGELYDNGLLHELYKNNLLQHIGSAKTIVDILNDKFKLVENRNYVN